MGNLKGLALATAFTASMPCFAYTGHDLQDWAGAFDQDHRNRDFRWKSSMFVGYVAGVGETIQWVVICPTAPATHLQNAAIVSKFIRNNPERWSENASTLTIAALRAVYPACKD